MSAHLETKCKESPQKSPQCSLGTFFAWEVSYWEILEARVGIEPVLSLCRINNLLILIPQ